MARSQFDKKMGAKFMDSIPAQPGVYRIFDSEAVLIYVGKAKNLKRRLGQYRNANRRKKHRKMNRLVKEGVRIEVEICTSELDALVLETKLIQEHRPKWNVAGAFYFLYPLMGLKKVGDTTLFCYTTEPSFFSEYELFGSFRSKYLTREAFFALMGLLPYIAHRESRNSSRERNPKYSYSYGYRQISEELHAHLTQFLRGDSKSLLEFLVMQLVENAGARSNTDLIQEHLNSLVRFWNHEIQPLSRARGLSQHAEYPVGQRDRDLIFIKYRAVTSEVRR